MRRPLLATLLGGQASSPSHLASHSPSYLASHPSSYLAFSVMLAAGCTTQPQDHVVRVRGGVGSTAFAGTPAVVEVELRLRDTSGVERSLAHAPVEGGTLAIPDDARTGLGALSLVGHGADGTVLAYGRTPVLELSGFDSSATRTVAIQVQRPRSVLDSVQWSTPPLADERGAPLRCAIVSARYAVATSSTSTQSWLIDLLDVTARSEADAFPSAPTMLATAGDHLLTIDVLGSATDTSLATSQWTVATAPSPISWLDTLGATAIAGDDDASWIVLPTRTATASDLVVRFDDTGASSTRTFTRARQGGVATWAPSRGLVLLGGNDPTVELLASSSQRAIVTHTEGPTDVEMLAALDDHRLLVIHGVGTVGLFDLTCAGCPEQPLQDGAGNVLQLAAGVRSDDATVALEGGSAVVLRNGELSRIEVNTNVATRTVLGTAAPGACLVGYPTGVVGVIAPTDALVRTVSGPR